MCVYSGSRRARLAMRQGPANAVGARCRGLGAFDVVLASYDTVCPPPSPPSLPY